MNIAVLQTPLLCVRARKQIQCLRDAPEIKKLITITEVRDKSVSDYCSLIPNDELVAILKKENIDIVHSHNWPDVNTVRLHKIREKYLPKMKIIHDTHDPAWFYDYNNEVQHIPFKKENEKWAQNQADGRVYISEGMKSFYWAKYEVDQETSISLPSYQPKVDIELHKKGNGRAVYEGCLNTTTRDYRPTFKTLHKKIPVEIFSQRTQFKKDYPYAFRSISDHTQLLNELAKYSIGIKGANFARMSLAKLANPNKLFDYIAAGIPIVFGPPLGDFEVDAYRYDIGVNVEDFDYSHLSKMRQNVRKIRERYWMENHIGKLLELYKKVME